MPKTRTTDEFIALSSAKHNNLYDYSKVKYVNSHTKVLIIDPEYGEFWQTPMAHLQHGQGHPKRGSKRATEKRTRTKEEFIRVSVIKHGNIYDYSKVEYVNSGVKVCIIDPEYGEFWQTPDQHLHSHGCPARTLAKGHTHEDDHIIPISIIRSTKRKHNEWSKNRPLYLFLNSDINKNTLKRSENKSKSDTIIINDVPYTASSLRNNYDVIKYLVSTQLKIDVSDIIEQDKKYISDMLAIDKLVDLL